MPAGDSRLNADAIPTSLASARTQQLSDPSLNPHSNPSPAYSATTSHSSYLSALRQIDSILVPDLAATLTNPSSSAPAATATTAATATNRSQAPHRDRRDESWPRDPQNEWRAQNATANERLRAVRDQLLTREFSSAATALAEMERLGESRGSGNTGEDMARRERLQRVLSRLNRLHGNAPSSESYGETAPTHNSLYDWSPPSMAEVDNAGEEAELDTIRRELRRQLPNHHPEVLRVMAESVRADMQRVGAASSSRFSNFQHEGAPARTEQSLRSQAILQAVRRHPRFSARSREYMQRYIVDRADRNDRSGSGTATPGGNSASDARERYSSSSDRYAWARRSIHDPGTNEDSSSTRLRRSMLADPPSNSSDTSSDLLKRAVEYLGNLRRSQTYEDSLGHAVDARFVTKEFFGERHDDFVLDVHSLAPIYPTSVLARGSKFKGFQRAHPEVNPPNNSRRRRWERDLGRWEHEPPSWEQYAPRDRRRTSQDYLPRLTLDDPTRPTSQVPPHAQRASSNRYTNTDQWPVEVTIHDVDWERMTVSATMAAQDVLSNAPHLLDARRAATTDPYAQTDTPDSMPDLVDADGNIYRPSSRQHRIPTPPPQLPPLSALLAADTNSAPKRDPNAPLKTITTYVEGEILDFRRHTFLTESFKSNPGNDACYWRKLEPFRDLTDEEVGARLLSRSFLHALSEEYILMRWKERCFVEDVGNGADSGEQNVELGEGASSCGLTISGFYYVCLRRSDGHVEGLYCDPNSSPYQHLVLERSRQESYWWGWEFK